jgi:peptidoglycan/LPS O-acetylase OafA/YrhL
MIGAMGAILYYNKNTIFFRVCFSLPVQVLAWLSIVLMALNKFHTASVTDSELVAVIAVVLITNVSANSKTLIDLEKPLFDFLGKISYGMYVYHPLIIFLAAKWAGNLVGSLDPAVRMIVLFTAIPALTILIAYLSYEFFEKRFLRLKTKYSFIHSSDTAKSIDTEMPAVSPVASGR